MADFSRLPGPNADLWDWQLRGLCRGKDSSLFFHPEGERGAARSSRESAAKEICLNCPVLISCANHALKVREPYGVWGGMTEDERLEHHARQKALVRAQAAREKAARAQQAKLKEKLLRDKAAQTAAQNAAQTAAQTAAQNVAQPRGTVRSEAHAGASVGTAATATGSRATLTTTVRPAKGAGSELHEAQQPVAASAPRTAAPAHAAPKNRPPAHTAPKKAAAAKSGAAKQGAKSLASVS
jgi:WhiB family redox-sensing transcriptional regulator